MTSRQAGRRIAANTRRRTRSIRGGARKSEPLEAKDLRLMLRLVACGGIFVALVAAKLLLPARMEAFNEKLSAAMERNMDVQAVFSAVGRAFSGEESVAGVYQAVFHPEEGAVQTGALSPADSPPKMTARAVQLRDGAALEVLRRFRPETPSQAEAAKTAKTSAAKKAGTPEEG